MWAVTCKQRLSSDGWVETKWKTESQRPISNVSMARYTGGPENRCRLVVEVTGSDRLQNRSNILPEWLEESFKSNDVSKAKDSLEIVRLSTTKNENS